MRIPHEPSPEFTASVNEFMRRNPDAARPTKVQPPPKKQPNPKRRKATQAKQRRAAKRKRQQAAPKPIHDGRSVKQNMPYDDYLLTEHWAIVRTEMVRRAKYRCKVCDATGLLNVHHVTYEHLWFEYAADLKVLCDACHRKAHGLT